MKQILLVLGFVLLSAVVQAQEIKWLSFNEAVALQKKMPKKIIMDVYTNWCGPCKMLDKRTFQNKDVVDYVNANFYAVKFNGEGKESINFNGKELGNANYNPAKEFSRNSPHDFTRTLGVSAYPTIVFFDETGTVIAPIRGFQQPQQLELYLKLFNSDAYKNMNNQESFNAYYEAFVPEFKD